MENTVINYKTGRPDEVYKFVLDVGCRLTPLQLENRQATKDALGDISAMQVPPDEGEFLKFLVKISKAKRGLEIGTFTGYSSLCIAEALPDDPDSKLYCFDNSEKFTDIAKTYWKKGGVEHKIELILGNACEILQERFLDDEKLHGAFDFSFIDADKPNYMFYYESSLKLVKSGGWIAVDNILWHNIIVGKVHSPRAKILRELAEFIHEDQRVEICMTTMADGILLVYKK